MPVVRSDMSADTNSLALAGLVTVNMPRLMLAPEQKVEA